jgi:diguanylate cyclase (GGDEF)-like protein
MTLYRQLLAFIFILFIVLFASTWVVKLQSTRVFLENQLESHAQDTATSLGLSISTSIAENDLATVETMINAVFDRGYYSRILLVDLDEKKLIERELEVAISRVPAWFIRAIPLQMPEAGTLISSGWKQVGSLHVVSHPGYAYKTLWDATVNMAKIYGLIGLFALFLGAVGLRLLLRPLQRIEQQAEDICRKQYTIQERLPKTRELRSVVTAMNSMTGKVKQMFYEQAQVADRLRKNTYSDVLTGLGNRRYLQGQVAARMDRGDTSVTGAFLLVQIRDLMELNQERGYQYGDQILQTVAENIREATRYLKNAALARISGGTFAIFLPDVTGEDARHVAASIVGDLAGVAVGVVGAPENVGHVGGVIFNRTAPIGLLLSEADRMLSAAQKQGPNAWLIGAVSPEADEMPSGQQEWKQILEQVLTEKKITLFGQSVVPIGNLKERMHLEILSRIILETGQMISAGLFIPLAERLRCISAIDRVVLEKTLQFDYGGRNISELAVNISPTSLRDTDFVSWLTTSLKKLPSTAPRMIFEFAEFNATREMALLQKFSREVKELGHSVGLDHFGQSFANFGYLKSLQPKYVKIDKAFTDELKAEEGDSNFFIGSLVSVAHSLDILVIAEGVEDEKQLQILRDLNIDGIQGYLVDQPAELEA